MNNKQKYGKIINIGSGKKIRIKDLKEWENSVILDYPPITLG